jgi:hypothetical protein
VVLKSEGAVREHQADVLGVYRMVDSYNERPVYKQDGGENYIYYRSNSTNLRKLIRLRLQLRLLQYLKYIRPFLILTKFDSM